MPESNQFTILKFIQNQQDKQGYAPTVREIADHIGVSSTATVHGHLNRLIKKGYLTRKQTKSRALAVTTAGHNLLNEQETTSSIPLFDPSNDSNTPDAVSYRSVPEQLIAQDSHLFMIHQENENMIDIGILPGDVLIVNHQTTANNGDIILVTLPDQRKQVYRFFDVNDHIKLVPENQQLNSITLDSVEILGKIVSLYRPTIL